MRKLADLSVTPVTKEGIDFLGEKGSEAELDITKRIAKYPEVLASAATQLEPHVLTHYLRDLASEFHTYYNANKVLVDDASLRNARITISLAVQQVLKNGLNLLGVSAPSEM